MAQMNKYGALCLATMFRIPLDSDFHALNSEAVERVLLAADHVKYRKPANAKGSRARCFHAYMKRAAARDD